MTGANRNESSGVCVLLLKDSPLVDIAEEEVIGRKDFQDALPPQEMAKISGKHLRVFRDESGYWVEDGYGGRPSTNGTKLNGKEIRNLGPQRLNPGDVLQIAGTVDLTVAGPTGEPTAPPSEAPKLSLGLVWSEGGSKFLEDETVLGREDFGDVLSLEDLQKISGKHLRVFRDESGYWVEDGYGGRPSTNGTKLNGREIRNLGPQRMEVGDILKIAGVIEVTLGVPEVEVAPPPPPPEPVEVAAEISPPAERVVAEEPPEEVTPPAVVAEQPREEEVPPPDIMEERPPKEPRPEPVTEHPPEEEEVPPLDVVVDHPPEEPSPMEVTERPPEEDEEAPPSVVPEEHPPEEIPPSEVVEEQPPEEEAPPPEPVPVQPPEEEEPSPEGDLNLIWSSGWFPVEDEMVLGRKHFRDQLPSKDHSRISGNHLRVYRDESGYWVEDGYGGRPSTNGTKLNGKEISNLGPQRLTVGDVLVLSDIVEIRATLEVPEGPPVPAAVPAPPAKVKEISRPSVEVPATPPGAPKPASPRVEAFKRLASVIRSLQKGDLEPISAGAKRIFDTNRRIRPGFSASWVTPRPPEDSELLLEYEVDGMPIRVYEVPDEMDNLYFFVPPEYRFSISHLKMLDSAKEQLLAHHPSGLDIERPEDVRKYVRQVAERIVPEIARRQGLKLGKTRALEASNIANLANVLAKYTAGFGIAETLLSDGRINDVYIDSPAPLNPVHLTISSLGNPRIRGRCRTNIALGEQDAEALLARFRYDSGRPFSEAFPVLEHNLDAHDTRVTVIGKPLSPSGVAMALRKHSTEPWTLPRLMAVKSLNATAAGLLSFLIDGKSTILVAGSRGSGKTSLLSALMLEFPPSQRILTIEDTLELPVEVMQGLGYKVQSMAVQSSLGGRGEMTADEALRVSLRLGESALVLGEVRGQEARTLYEAMRAGTAGSSVLGTFHADSAKSVFERVVHDMGIGPKSFGATDVVVIAGLSRPGGVLKETRRVLQIAELEKSSGVDGNFQDLMTYDDVSDSLIESDIMKYSSEKVGKIARSWGLTMEQALHNIEMRGAYRQKMVDFAKENDKPIVLGAAWVARANSVFWSLLEKQQAAGIRDYDRILSDWTSWFERRAGYA